MMERAMSDGKLKSCGRGNGRRFVPVAVKSVASVVSGMLLASAFPPVESSECAWIALAPMIVVARFARPFQAFLFGFLGGIVFWLWSLSWLLAMINCGGNLFMTVLAWVALSAYCSLYTGAFSSAVSWLFMAGKSGGADVPCAVVPRGGLNVLYVMVIPLLWVGFEYLRSTLFSGFPWNAVGISQYRNLAVIQLAEWGGVYAVSALVVMMNAVMALVACRFIDTYTTGRRVGRINFELLLGLAVGLMCMTHGIRTVRRVNGEPCHLQARIALVQPNVRQVTKWDDSQVMAVYEKLVFHSRIATAGGPDLIVWPETAVLDAVEGDDDFVYCASDEAGSGGIPILAGAIESEGRFGPGDGSSEPDRVFNSSFLLATDGSIAGRYRKRHLVPFGEYVPFDKVFRFLQRLVPIGQTIYPGERGTVFSLPLQGDRPLELKFSVMICFEDIIAGLARDDVREGARLLVNQTNDGWFDGSSEHIQHMVHCVFRCVENRVPAVRCANTGVTCFIDRTGRIADGSSSGAGMLPVGSEGVMIFASEIPGEDMALTFYTKYGDIPFAMPCGIACFLLIAVMAGKAVAQGRKKGKVGGE